MDEMESMLQTADYVVIGIVLSFSAGIGVFYRFTGGKQKTTEEYFSANKSMSVLPLSMALMVSFISAVTLLGISGEIYGNGGQFAVYYIGVILATVVTSYFYLPVFFNIGSLSVYEYLEKRFGVKARLLTSIANFIQLTLYTGIVLYAPSLALEATTGLSSNTSIVFIGVICMFYSTIGGIKAVLVTDIFQGFLMFGSLICVYFVASEDLDGGLSKVWEIATAGNRTDFFDFTPDLTIRHTFWSLVTGGFCLFLSLYGVNQVEVQRLKTVKTLSAARMALYLNLPLLVGIGLMTSFSGLILYAVYKDCDPLSAGFISSQDKIMPYFAATKMSRYPGLTGLFIAGIFSASLSTISAMLNSLSAIFLEDYLKPFYEKRGKTFPKDKATMYGKILASVNGLVCLCLAFLAGKLGSLVQLAILVNGSICGPVLGIFTLGLFFEHANEKGAVVGMLTGLITCMWTSLGHLQLPKHLPLPSSIDGCNSTTILLNESSPHHDEKLVEEESSSYFVLYRLSYMLYSAMGADITIIVGFLASLIFRKLQGTPDREPDPELFTPLLARWIRRRRAKAQQTSTSELFQIDDRKKRKK